MPLTHTCLRGTINWSEAISPTGLSEFMCLIPDVFPRSPAGGKVSLLFCEHKSTTALTVCGPDPAYHSRRQEKSYSVWIFAHIAAYSQRVTTEELRGAADWIKEFSDLSFKIGGCFTVKVQTLIVTQIQDPGTVAKCHPSLGHLHRTSLMLATTVLFLWCQVKISPVIKTFFTPCC